MRYNNHASARKLPNGGSENDFFLPLFSLETPPAVWSTAGGVFRGKASQQSGSEEGAPVRSVSYIASGRCIMPEMR